MKPRNSYLNSLRFKNAQRNTMLPEAEPDQEPAADFIDASTDRVGPYG